jgi:Bacterial membrane protein YfhO
VTRLRRHPTLAAALISLVLAAIMVGPALVPGRVLSSADIWWFWTPWAADPPAGLTEPANADLQDAAQQFQPLREEVRRQLPEAPLWNPWISGGRPLLADAQSAVFSPFNLPAWVLPLQNSLAWTALLVLWAATFGMYLLARALGMGFAGALMAGIVYGLNLWLVSHLSYPHSAAWALLPWLLWATERLVRRPDARSVAVLAVLVALQYFGGHPETSFHVLLGTVAFFALRVALARRHGVRAPLLAMGAALVAGTTLAAVMLVPFAELLLNSADLAERSGDSVDQHQTGALGLAFFLYDYWGRSTETALPPFPFLFARSWYVGALPLMLAAAALVLRPRAERLWIAGAGLVLVAVIFGVPPFLQIATRLPLLSLGHNDRLILLVLACLALLAGWGLDDLLSRDVLRERRRALVIAAAVVLAVPFVWVLASGDIDRWVPREAIEVALELAEPPAAADPAASDVIRLGTLVLWTCLAGAAFVLILLRVRGLPARWFAGLALALVVVDLMRAGIGYNPSIPEEHADYPVTGALRHLADRTPARFAGAGDDVPHNLPALWMRLHDARGYDLPILERYNKLWRREVSPEYPDLTSTFVSLFLQVPRIDERRLRTLRLLGVTDLLVPPQGSATEPEGLDTPGLRPVYEGADARVLRVEGALPRTFVAGAQQTVDGGDAALDAVTSPELDARNVVVTEKRLPGVPESDAGPAGSARIVSYEPDRVVIDARLDRRGVVVLGDNWFPGWQATVDGRPVDIERVDYVLRGTVVDRGRHKIEYRYQPASWRIGWIVSLLTLLALVGAVLLSRRRAAASPR